MTLPQRIRLLIAMLILPILAVAADTLSVDTMPLSARDASVDADSVPLYVRIVCADQDADIYRLPDSLFYEFAGSLVFRVNSTRLDPAAPILGDIVRRVVPLMHSRHLKVEAIDMRGAASPEGPYYNNVRLSKGRARTLLDYLRPHLGDDAIDKITISTVAEDYQYLYYTLVDRGDPNAEVVKAIIDECTIANHRRLKRRLQRYDNGKLWAYLLKNVFPSLRAARLVIYLSRNDEKLDASATLPAVPLPEMALPPLPAQRLAAAAVSSKAGRKHMMSIGTNLLYDAMYIPQYGMSPMPNLAVEFYPRRGNFTFAAAFTFPYYHRWDKHKFFQIRDYHLEVRRYFRPGLHHTGAYLGVYANANIYGIGFSATKGWEGEGWGAAVKGGYVVRLGGRWRLDFHLAVGGYITRYDPYVYGNPITGSIDGDYYYDYTGKVSDFHRRNHRFSWFGPTEAGITVTYDFLFY